MFKKMNTYIKKIYVINRNLKNIYKKGKVELQIMLLAKMYFVFHISNIYSIKNVQVRLLKYLDTFINYLDE